MASVLYVNTSMMTFPDGAAGVGLLLLRVSVALSPAETAIGYSGFGGWIGTILTIALLFGILTRFASAASAALALFCLVQMPHDFGRIAGTHFLCAAALVALGAGAYSVDARLFGRRVITLEAKSNGNGR